MECIVVTVDNVDKSVNKLSRIYFYMWIPQKFVEYLCREKEDWVLDPACEGGGL